MTSEMLPNPPDLFDLFGKHLVGLLLRVQDLGLEPNQASLRDIAIPGILLRVEDAAFFLTAGHVIEDLQNGLSGNKFRLEKCFLVDTFGAGVKSNYPIAFDFVNSFRPHLVNDQAGLDFGLILLAPYYERLLKINGIVPFEEVNWATQHKVDFEFYFLLGFPAELNRSPPSSGDAEVHPVLIPMDPIDILPDDLEVPKADRFYAKIREGMDLDLRGMSGGPVFGFRTKPQLEYWIVAIQSGWYQQHRISVGCRMQTIGWMVSEAIRKMKEDGLV